MHELDTYAIGQTLLLWPLCERMTFDLVRGLVAAGGGSSGRLYDVARVHARGRTISSPTAGPSLGVRYCAVAISISI